MSRLPLLGFPPYLVHKITQIDFPLSKLGVGHQNYLGNGCMLLPRGLVNLALTDSKCFFGLLRKVLLFLGLVSLSRVFRTCPRTLETQIFHLGS